MEALLDRFATRIEQKLDSLDSTVHKTQADLDAFKAETGSLINGLLERITQLENGKNSVPSNAQSTTAPVQVPPRPRQVTNTDPALTLIFNMRCHANEPAMTVDRLVNILQQVNLKHRMDTSLFLYEMFTSQDIYSFSRLPCLAKDMQRYNVEFSSESARDTAFRQKRTLEQLSGQTAGSATMFYQENFLPDSNNYRTHKAYAVIMHELWKTGAAVWWNRECKDHHVPMIRYPPDSSEIREIRSVQDAEHLLQSILDSQTAHAEDVPNPSDGDDPMENNTTTTLAITEPVHPDQPTGMHPDPLTNPAAHLAPALTPATVPTTAPATDTVPALSIVARIPGAATHQHQQQQHPAIFPNPNTPHPTPRQSIPSSPRSNSAFLAKSQRTTMTSSAGRTIPP
jgi:hypothetical protein